MAVRSVVWDMDGTLLDSTVVVPAAFVLTLRRIGGPTVAASEVIAAYPLGPAEVILEHLAGRPVTRQEIDVYYGELERATVLPYPGITEALAGLRTCGQPIAVFTGASRRAAVTLLSAAGLHVDVLVGGDEIANPKPAADGLLLVAGRLGVTPAELIYVGDSPGDMGAARAAGAFAAAAAWGHMFDPGEAADSVLGSPEQVLALLD